MLYASTYYGIAGLGDDSLYHHGVKGQKWGVRRFQNADGTYTQAGRNRYFTDDGSLSKKGERAYRKDLKKLNKLKARADISQQKKNIEKYEKRAEKATDVARSAAGVFLATRAASLPVGIASIALGKRARGINDKLDAADSVVANKGYDAMRKAQEYRNKGLVSEKQYQSRLNKVAGDANRAFDKNYADYDKSMAPIRRAGKALDVLNTARKVAKYGSLGVAAGAGATYVYSKMQADAARKRISDLGHEKAVADVNRQIEYMKQTYGSVKLSDLDKKKR